MEHRRLSPIKTLIENRSRDLGLSRQDIVQRAGYRNLVKGCRRLDELLTGDVRESITFRGNGCMVVAEQPCSLVVMRPGEVGTGVRCWAGDRLRCRLSS